jgi:hypothetical protein
MNSVTHAQKDFAAIQLTAEQKRDLDRWVEIEFTCAALRLEGVAASREEVARLAAESITGGAGAREERNILATLKAIAAVRSLVEASGGAALLTPALLIELHGGSEADALSDLEVAPPPSPAPDAAARLIAKLEAACHWFAAESFIELHPAEQAAIVLMRLIELKPFEEGDIRTALAASSLFSIRSGLPPIIVSPDQQTGYRAALNEGMKMNTKPMVDLVAQALVTTVSEMVERVRSK